MSYGLQIWDASGNLVVDSSRRLGRFIGSFMSGTTGGSFTPSGLPSGYLFAFTNTSEAGSPGIWTNGSGTIFWSFDTFMVNQGFYSPISVEIIYGVF